MRIRREAYDVQPSSRPCADSFFITDHTTSHEAGMPRGDELRDEYRFSDRDDDVDDLGYGGGGGGGGGRAPYDDADEEDGGGMPHKTDSDGLWDSADDVDEEDEEGGGAAPVDAGDEEEDEGDPFSAP